jgi:glycosyltransferase involved in cell wall biosynthesis
MRICLVSQEYPPETARGGIGSQTHAKAHGLASRGHEICVVSAAEGGRAREYRDGPVRVFRVPGFDSRMCLNTEPARWLTYSAEVAATLSTLHGKTPFHLVDFPDYGAEGYIWLLNRAAWDYVPAVLHLHGPLVMFAHTMGWPEVDSEFYCTGTVMESACFRLADAVCSSSQCSAAWCTRYYGERRGPIPTIHTGVDVGLFQPDAASKAAQPTIVFAGRIDSNKGVSTLVEAACVLAQEFAGLRLQIIGDGDRELIESLRDRALDCGQPELLEFTGYVPREELPSHLAGAHIFAAPSVYEGGPGLVYLEAMACGLPVIACRGNGASEVIHDSESGLLVPPRDVRAVIEALRALLSNGERRQSMGLRARQFVEAGADTRNCLDLLEAFYRCAAHQEAA